MNDRLDSPFADLQDAIVAARKDRRELMEDKNGSLQVDPGRWRRTGIPEVVYASGKQPAEIAEALRLLARLQGRALASRLGTDELDAVRTSLEPEFNLETFARSRCVVASVPGAARPSGGGVVGVLSAGSSDLPIALEATVMAAEMGATVLEAWDVGVAGLHRLVEPLERFAARRVDVIVVAAGMDGALPSVVSGLVDVPVIGLPTSIGYGFGGGGIGALTTMLQSCAPGLVVVNIDNGIGAGATAALIANRAGKSREAYIVNSSGNDADSSLRGDFSFRNSSDELT